MGRGRGAGVGPAGDLPVRPDPVHDEGHVTGASHFRAVLGEAIDGRQDDVGGRAVAGRLDRPAVIDPAGGDFALKLVHRERPLLLPVDGDDMARVGEVEIKGPMTKEEKARYDMFAKAKVEFQAELDELQQLLRDEPDYQYREQVLADIEHNKKLLDIVSRVILD